MRLFSAASIAYTNMVRILPDQHLELDSNSVFSKCIFLLIKKISSHQKYVHGYETRISDSILSFSQLLFLNVRNILLVFRFLFATCPCSGHLPPFLVSEMADPMDQNFI